MERISLDDLSSPGVPPMSRNAAEKLGIDLGSRREGELFKWFLACLLFGKPVQQEVAERAYMQLISAGLRGPDAVLNARWDELVRLLDEAHYLRYDFSTATKLLDVCWNLKQGYGTLTELISHSASGHELSARLQEFKHVGPVTHGFSPRRWPPSGIDPQRFRHSDTGGQK